MRTLAGMFSSRCAASTAFTASPSAAPGARLKEMVIAGNWPTWPIDSGPARSVTVAMLESGTCTPPAPGTKMSFRAAGPPRNSGFTSSTTRYWVDCVKMVETSRWPKAL
jgi:hypothetical protein